MVTKRHDKLDVGVPMPRQKFENGKLCVRCEENTTPPNEMNNMCNECIDFVRAQRSKNEWSREFSKEVREA